MVSTVSKNASASLIKLSSFWLSTSLESSSRRSRPLQNYRSLHVLVKLIFAYIPSPSIHFGIYGQPSISFSKDFFGSLLLFLNRLRQFQNNPFWPANVA